jgi:hypothetical protein
VPTDTNIREAVVAAARGTFGATLRSVLFYAVEDGEPTEEVWFLRDDAVETQEDAETRIAAFSQDFPVESVGGGRMNPRELGELRASLRLFEEAVVVRIHSYGRSGVVVSVDPDYYGDLSEFVGAIDDYLAGEGVMDER